MTLSFIKKITTLSVTGLACLSLAACGDDAAESGAYSVMLSAESVVELNDGPMAEVNACIEANNTDHLSPASARTMCAWAFSSPFAGTPPGIVGYLAYEWPNVTITVQNNNAIILLTEICLQIQFDSARNIQNACGNILVGPSEQSQATIPLRGRLDRLAIDAAYEIDMETFIWEISSARFIQLLEPANQTQEQIQSDTF